MDQARHDGGAEPTEPSPQSERPGDPACWLRRVCEQCGTLADEDPPTTCPHCQASIPDLASQ